MAKLETRSLDIRLLLGLDLSWSRIARMDRASTLVGVASHPDRLAQLRHDVPGCLDGPGSRTSGRRGRGEHGSLRPIVTDGMSAFVFEVRENQIILADRELITAGSRVRLRVYRECVGDSSFP